MAAAPPLPAARRAAAAVAGARRTATAAAVAALTERARHAEPGAARPPLRVVPSRARHRSSLAPRVLLAALTCLGVFGTVTLNAVAAEASFRARTLAAEVSALQMRHDELVADVASLSAPDRVRAVARGHLGLVPADQPGFLVVPDDAGAPQDAKPVRHLRR